MSEEKKINLDKLIDRFSEETHSLITGDPILHLSRDGAKAAIREGIRQALEIAFENAKIISKTQSTPADQRNIHIYKIIDKESITDTIKLVV